MSPNPPQTIQQLKIPEVKCNIQEHTDKNCPFLSFQLEFRHKIDSELMLYPGYEPAPNQDVRLLHYGLNFGVDQWQFGKAEHTTDRIVNQCNKLFPPPPFPADVRRGGGKATQSLLEGKTMKEFIERLSL